MDHLTEVKILSQAIFNKKKYGREQQKKACKAHFEQIFLIKEYLHDGLTSKAEKIMFKLREDLTKGKWIPQFYHEDGVVDRILGTHNHRLQLFHAGCFRCVSEKLIEANSALAAETEQARREAKAYLDKFAKSTGLIGQYKERLQVLAPYERELKEAIWRKEGYIKYLEEKLEKKTEYANSLLRDLDEAGPSGMASIPSPPFIVCGSDPLNLNALQPVFGPQTPPGIPPIEDAEMEEELVPMCLCQRDHSLLEEGEFCDRCDFYY